MSLMIIDYDANGNPIQPAVDPLTQTLEIVEIDGVRYWRVTSYSIEERNDGSEPYVEFFTVKRDGIVGSITRLTQTHPLWEILTELEQQSILDYQTQVSSLTEFLPGFSFPQFKGEISSVPMSVIGRFVRL